MEIRKSLAIAIAAAGVSSSALAGWDGPYVGISGGGGFGNQGQSGGQLLLPGTSGAGGTTCITTAFSGTTFTTCPVSTGPANADGAYHLSGGLVGGTVGYNFQWARWVFGLEGDGSWADISGSGTCGFGGALPHLCGGSIDALGTVRARFGYDLGPVIPRIGNVLAYATGGLAIGDIHAWDSLFGTSGHKTEAGWTVGGGLEAMLNANWSVKLEYLYADFGNPAVFTAIPPNPEHVSTHVNIVRLGLNYRFDWGPPSTPPPIATKAPWITK